MFVFGYYKGFKFLPSQKQLSIIFQRQFNQLLYLSHGQLMLDATDIENLLSFQV